MVEVPPLSAPKMGKCWQINDDLMSASTSLLNAESSTISADKIWHSIELGRHSWRITSIKTLLFQYNWSRKIGPEVILSINKRPLSTSGHEVNINNEVRLRTTAHRLDRLGESGAPRAIEAWVASANLVLLA